MDRRVNIDLDAVRRAREGDREAFAQLVAQTMAPLRAFLSRQLRDAEEVDDLTQDIYIRAWTKLGELRDADRFAGWLWRIARFAAIDHTRHRCAKSRDFVTTPIEDLSEPMAPDLEAAQWLEREGLRQRVAACLEEMPELPREILRLRYAEGLSYLGIAERLELKPTQVKARLARARRKIRGRLGPIARDWERLNREMP
jgi:RNA polymerase sigma-70 factor, ECF subfamily